MCTVLMGNSSQVLIKKEKKKEDEEQEDKGEEKMDLFGNFESINLQLHPSQS